MIDEIKRGNVLPTRNLDTVVQCGIKSLQLHVSIWGITIMVYIRTLIPMVTQLVMKKVTHQKNPYSYSQQQCDFQLQIGVDVAVTQAENV